MTIDPAEMMTEPISEARYDTPLWCCGQLDILIHLYTTTSDYKYRGKFYDDCVAYFVSIGFVNAETKSVTTKGKAFIGMLLSTPIPVEEYTDPRTGGVIHHI